MSLKNMAGRLPSPIKKFVKRKLNERGFYDIRDGKGLNERGFYDMRDVGEITTIDEFKERAFAICKRARLQTKEDVIAQFIGRTMALSLPTVAAASPRELRREIYGRLGVY